MSESERNVDRAQEILPLQVGILYDNGPVMLVANIVNAGLATVILGPELGRKAYFWCAAIIVVALVRGILSLAYRHRYQALPVLTWAWLFTLGSIVSGMVWGLGCAVLFVPGNILAQLVVAFVAAGMAAGGAVGLCAWLPAALGFVTAILMGLLLVLLAQGEVHYNVMAAMTGLMWFALSVIAINFNRMIRRSLGVGLENRELSERLQRTETTRAANQARSWFLSAMSHELRTPLNATWGSRTSSGRKPSARSARRATRTMPKTSTQAPKGFSSWSTKPSICPKLNPALSNSRKRRSPSPRSSRPPKPWFRRPRPQARCGSPRSCPRAAACCAQTRASCGSCC